MTERLHSHANRRDMAIAHPPAIIMRIYYLVTGETAENDTTWKCSESMSSRRTRQIECMALRSWALYFTDEATVRNAGIYCRYMPFHISVNEAYASAGDIYFMAYRHRTLR